MGRNPVKVCVRTRPTASFAQDVITIDREAQVGFIHVVVTSSRDCNNFILDISLHAPPLETGKRSPATVGMHDNRQNCFKFQFHHVLHNAGQDTIYDGLARDVVQGAVDGISGCIMSYGQTGSGKSFTMTGDSGNYQHRGISPRALSHIFQEVHARIETAFTVTITYMEIYNERIFDLLLDPGVHAPKV
ncbi:unnamed protein product [Discosporangium mesarthrocarpum]